MKDFELLQMRNAALYDAYCEGIDQNYFENTSQAIDYARTRPAPQFFITARNASLAIGKIAAGRDLGCNENNKKKYHELYRRYLRYLTTHPRCTMSREHICEILVDEPAPEYYLGQEMAEKIIRKERERKLEEMYKRFMR